MGEYVQLIGCDLPSAPCGAVLWSDEARCMFNVPEGSQRFCGEVRFRPTRINVFFFTRCTVETMMGLPGFLFTVNDTGVLRATLCGPKATLDPFLATMKTAFFAYRKMELLTIDGGSNGLLSWSEGPMRVQGFQLSDEVISYFCTLVPEPSLLPKKAKELGVLPGPKYSALKRGETIESDSIPGLMVKPEDVLVYRANPLPAVLVVDVDTLDQLRSLFQKLPLVECALHTIVHMSPMAVAGNSGSSQYFEAVGQLLNENHLEYHAISQVVARCGRTAFPTALVHRHHLHRIAPDFFHFEDDAAAASSTDSSWGVGTRYLWRKAEARPDALKFPTVESALSILSSSFKQKLEEFEECKRRSGNQAVLDTPADFSSVRKGWVTFLGTGSALPSKYRNVSSCLFRPEIAFPSPSILFDCGEGTLGQIWNVWGEQWKQIVCDIAIVFISHSHADHNLGLPALLKARRRLTDNPIVVAAPGDIIDFVRGLPQAHFFLDRCTFEFFPSDDVEDVRSENIERCWDTGLSHFPIVHELLSKIGWKGAIFPVPHAGHAHGISLRTPALSLVYSGDTVPSPTVAAAAANCDVLIHEATFDDTLAGEAAAKRHSTLQGALSVAQKAGARSLLLTHFSQRYPKIPSITASSTSGQMPFFCCVFDMMTVDCSKLHRLPLAMPMFQQLLEEYESWGQGTSKRMREE